MNIADRIQNLRKTKGISQEELAHQLGVSRQAVSKWESGQSIPDIEKIILLSDHFGVTTDSLLKGIEPSEHSGKNKDCMFLFNTAATAFNLLGVILSCLIWSSSQETGAVAAGFVFIILGLMLHAMGTRQSPESRQAEEKFRFWKANIWTVSFLPLSLFYNILTSGMTAPYPLVFANTYLPFVLFWAVYFLLCGTVTYIAAKKQHG